MKNSAKQKPLPDNLESEDVLRDPWVDDMETKINELTGVRRKIAEWLLEKLLESERSL